MMKTTENPTTMTTMGMTIATMTYMFRRLGQSAVPGEERMAKQYRTTIQRQVAPGAGV